MRGGAVPVLLTLALLCASALLARADAPMLAFTSHAARSAPLRAPDAAALTERGPTVSAGHVVARLLHHKDVHGVPELCSMDAVAVVQADVLHRDDFAALPTGSRSSLRRRVLQAPGQLVLPAVDQSAASVSEMLSERLAALCAPAGKPWRSVDVSADGEAPVAAPAHRPLFNMRIEDLARGEQALSAHLSALDSAFPEHVVVVTGCHGKPKHHMGMKRAFSAPGRNGTAKGSVFEHYSFFSAPTILGIGVAAFLLFFTLIPLSLIGSTRTPDKLGQPNRMSLEKKQQ